MTEEEETLARLVGGLRADQRRHWRKGERVGAETYFEQHPDLLGAAPRALELLYGEIMLCEENGEAPTLIEYAGRFPQFAAQLALLFEVHQAIESGQLLEPQAGATSLHLASPGPMTAECADTSSWPAVAGYEILGELGRGGMGVVYKARQSGLDRVVALKMILVGSHADPAQLARFRAEAAVIARLDHPNIVKIHEVGAQDGRPYFSLEFVDGGSLAQAIAARRLPIADSQDRRQWQIQAATLLIAVARAMHHAHQHGILHRDLKPANILLRRPDKSAICDMRYAIPMITDFGLAKNLRLDPGQTASGTILGTPSYMAPEQADGRREDIGPAADIYALGTILYELLAGEPPFKADTQLATLRLVLNEEPLSLCRVKAPADLGTICFKCLQKDPRRRYASALELADDLERFLGDRPIHAHRAGQVEHAWRWARRNPWAAGLSAAVVLLLATVAVVSTVSRFWLQDALVEAQKDRRAVEEANASATHRLWASYLHQAKAHRSSRKPGQRVAGLRAIQEALRLPVPPDQSLAELRTEAIACLLLPDFEVAREWDGWPAGSLDFGIDAAFERYARSDTSGNISVRRLADDKELYRLAGFGPRADWANLTFSSDGRRLLYVYYCPSGFRSRLWKLEGARPELVHEDDSALAFGSDGHRFAASGAEGSIRLFETASGKEVRRYHLGVPIRFMLGNPKFEKLAAFTSVDCRILDLESGKVSATMPISAGLAWHPDGRILAAWDSKQIQLWDTATGRLHMPPLVGHKSDGIQVKFSPSGDQLLSTDWSGIWRLWDMRTGTQLLTMPTISGKISFCRADRLVAADFLQPKIRLFRAYPGSEFRSVAHHVGAEPSTFRSVSALKADGRLLAVDVPEGIALIDIVRAEEVAVLPIPGNYPLRFDVIDNALWTYGNDGLLRWPLRIDAVAGTATLGPREILGTRTGGNYWGASADGRVFAIPTTQGPLLWQRDADQVIPLGPQQDVRFCAISPDGQWVATGSHDSRKGAGAKIWDAKTGKHVVDLPVGSFCFVAFSPDGRWLVTTSGGTRIWSVGTWQEGPNVGPTDFDQRFAFTADSKVLAIGGALGVVRLVETATGREIARLTAPEETRLWPQCFTPDGGQLVAIGHESSALHIFDLRAIRRQLAALNLDWAQPAHPPESPVDTAPLRIQVAPGEEPK